MHENAQKLSEKLAAKFLRLHCTQIACLDYAFSKIFELEASPVEGQSMQQKDKKRRKRKGEKKLEKKNLKT